MKRLQRKRAKGWRLPEGAVIVDRSTGWGNPFIVGEHGTREDCVRLFEQLIFGSICLSTGPSVAVQDAYIRYAMAHTPELRGHDLVCWCPLPEPGQPDLCHAAVLLAVCAKLDEKEAALGRPLTPADWSTKAARGA